jgi:hypothetical protein
MHWSINALNVSVLNPEEKKQRERSVIWEVNIKSGKENGASVSYLNKCCSEYVQATYLFKTLLKLLIP